MRGVLVTVIDLRRRMQLAERPLTRQARILLTIIGEETLGLLVDGVHRVARVPPEQFEYTAALIGEETTEHVAGIARVRKRDDWSAVNFVRGIAVDSSRGVATPRPGVERPVTDEDETDVIVVLNIESVCKVLAFSGSKS